MALAICAAALRPRPGPGEASLHSPEELKLLVAASQEAGLLEQAQQQVVERVFNIGDRRIADIMTPRLEIDGSTPTTATTRC